MKRITLVAVLVACGLLATSTPIFAQATTPSSNWFSGKATMVVLGRDDIGSSKFQEYRVVPKGVSMPVFSLQGSQNGKDFALLGQNISRDDQRYAGWVNVSWFGVSFDYNQIPHNMGYNGRTLFAETAPGVWSMNATVRKSLGDAVDAVAAAARTYPFYVDLLAPTIASAGYVDISALRERGDVTVDLGGGKLPFDLAFTYMRELKTGARGASGGDILGVVTSAVDVPEPLNEVVQDFGLRWAYNFTAGNVHAAFNRNIYNSRVDALVIDNPFRATDLAYVSTAVPGGPGQVRFSTSPDNEASRGAVGFMLKAARQTRVAGDVAFGTWTQNQPFLPYTINSVVLTGTGQPANSVNSLQQRSLDGKINTTSLNFAFSSRPVRDLGVRLRYRSYDYKDKSARFVIAGDTAGSPDRSWGAADTPSEEEPYGHATANRTDAKTGRLDAQVSYDVQDLTFEAAFRNTQSSWVGRAGSSGTDGDENGYSVAAVFHAKDWVGVRGVFDQAKRTVSGIETGSIAQLQGVMADHAERKSTRTGVDIELTPSSQVGVTFAYFRRNDDYPNRPNKSSSVPNTQSGLLEAKYDTYSIEADFRPNERAEISAYYSYDKNVQTNQWLTLISGTTNVNNLLNYVGSDKGNTFGANAVIQVVPEKWTFTLGLSHQKVDGFMDITSNTSGASGCCSFYNGRTTLSPPGAQDINDLDDTELTTAVADLAYAIAQAWTFRVGYAYEKYTYADAYASATTIFPQSVLFFLKGDSGPYKANLVFTSLNYRW